MSTTAYNLGGIISVLGDDTNFVYETVLPPSPKGEKDVDPADNPMSPDTVQKTPPERRNIVLAPLPPPPSPTAQLVVMNELGHARYGHAPVRVRLDTAFENGFFNQYFIKEVEGKVRAKATQGPLQIDAVLPLNHEVDLMNLFGHVSRLSVQVKCPIEIHVGTKFLDE